MRIAPLQLAAVHVVRPAHAAVVARRIVEARGNDSSVEVGVVAQAVRRRRKLRSEVPVAACTIEYQAQHERVQSVMRSIVCRQPFLLLAIQYSHPYMSSVNLYRLYRQAQTPEGQRLPAV